MKVFLSAAVLLVALLSSPARAGDPAVPVSRVAYSGLMSVAYEGAVFGNVRKSEEWTIHHDHGNEHREAVIEGRKLEVIYIAATNKSYSVMPGPTVLEMSDSQGFGLAWGIYQKLDPQRTNVVPEGREVVSGQKCTRYSRTGTDKDGRSIKVTWWFADAGFPVKVDYQGQDRSGPVGVTLLLKNIKIGPQDPALFQIPAGTVINAGAKNAQAGQAWQADMQERAAEVQAMPAGPERERAMEALKRDMEAHARQQIEQLKQSMTPEQRAKLEESQRKQK